MKPNDKLLLACFLLFVIFYMSYWNTHKINDIESFTSYYNTIYNQTMRNCRYMNKDIKEYFDSKKSGFMNYFNGKKKK